MKKLLSILLALTLTVGLLFAFSSCSDKPDIKFGKRYVKITEMEDGFGSDSRFAFIFERDGTGTFEFYKKYVSSTGEEYNYIQSGTVTFRWELLSNNGIKLFKDKVTYNDDDTKKTCPLPTETLYFSENVITYSYVSGGQFSTSSNTLSYILEDSDLYETVYEKND